MANNKDDKKVDGIGSAKGAKEVQKTGSVSQVESVQAAKGIGSVAGAGEIGQKRKATRIMTAQEREQLLQMIDEEAEKLIKSGIVKDTNKEVITKAVKMAVDSSIVLDTDLNKDKDGAEDKK